MEYNSSFSHKLDISAISERHKNSSFSHKQVEYNSSFSHNQAKYNSSHSHNQAEKQKALGYKNPAKIGSNQLHYPTAKSGKGSEQKQLKQPIADTKVAK